VTARFGRVASVLAAACLTIAGCGHTARPAPPTSIIVGLEVALTGSGQAIGQDLRDGFQLYLNTHGGDLGGHPVVLKIVDEGNTAVSAVAAATTLINQDKVDVLTGIVSADSYAAVAALCAKAHVPLVGSDVRPDLGNVDWTWSTSFAPSDPGGAMAPYLQSAVDGPVYVLGPNYPAGHDEVNGFANLFTALGGQLANPGGQPTWTNWPVENDFSRYLDQIAASPAKAVYAFFSGTQAVTFVRQYARSAAGSIPLYAAGVLTEGATLSAEGTAAAGIETVLNYSPDLDNAANRQFVAAWQASHAGGLPTTFAMASYDAATILDEAITAAGSPATTITPAVINAHLGGIGQIDSPRGAWQFNSAHAPSQRWYLRRVGLDGRVLTNLVVQDLDTMG
jgi:branched-chain amino acid transport system substrate-binding protein